MRHPDLYTAGEAAAYLAVTEAQIPTLEKDYGLLSHLIGRAKVFFKRDLDRTALLMVGLKPPMELERTRDLRMAR